MGQKPSVQSKELLHSSQTNSISSKAIQADNKHHHRRNPPPEDDPMSSESAPVANKHHDGPSPPPEDDPMLREVIPAVNSSLPEDDLLSSEAVLTVNTYYHRLISLPDDIFFEIISRVGLPREVVFTVSSTNFSIKQICEPTYDIYEFWTALDNLFNVLIPPFIDTFCLDLHAGHYEEPRCWPIIDIWARRLRAYNIEHFAANDSRRHRSDDRVYPLSIFRMHSLVSLELNMCHRIASSTTHSIILPNVKKLSLHWINYECLRRLLSCCPSLEDLSLSVNEPEKHSVSLTSKKLKRLCMRLEGVSMVDVIINAPILDELNYSSSSILSMQMLDSVSNIVKSVELDAYTTRVSRGPKKTIIFPNLTHLQLSWCWPLVIEAIGLMVHCPKLEVFVLRLIIFDKMVWNQEAVFVPVEHVKRIELHTSTIVDQFGEEILNLVTLLLRSAKVLEKLTLRGRCNYFNYLNKPQFYQTLFECVEATSRCQVELLGVYELTS